MVQISTILFGCYFVFEGAKGFRECGIKFGISKVQDKPITGKKGRILGSIVIAIGIALIGFGLFVVPWIFAA